eukprot:snap_masked-scaffold_49-processed-gene-1.58-mRNA-1 protein AED:0.05 eAED:0.06 QI:0/-1/0/1/-1/1/1/0/439
MYSRRLISTIRTLATKRQVSNLARKNLFAAQTPRISSSFTSTFQIQQKAYFSSPVPHGGDLVSLMQPEKESQLLSEVTKTIDINERQSCDVQLLMNGAFSPLDGFMDKDTYTSVVDTMRLPESHAKGNLLFGLPVVLDSYLPESEFTPGEKILLKFEGTNMAVLTLKEAYTPDKAVECKKCYETSELEHPGVRMVAMERGPTYISGEITGLNFPERIYPSKTPEELRTVLSEMTQGDVVAFQCRNPIHRAHYELFTRALDAPNVSKDGIALVHPTCGPTQEDDIPGDVRYKTYEVLKAEKQDPRVAYDYLPYSMHMAGPREAIQHMIIRKNYGCTHFIIGRDMAGSKSSITGEDYYGAYDAQDLASKHSEELGMQTVPSLNLVYTAEEGYLTADDAEKKGLKPVKLSGTEFRRRLRAGEDIPEWFAFKSVVEVLRAAQK